MTEEEDRDILSSETRGSTVIVRLHESEVTMFSLPDVREGLLKAVEDPGTEKLILDLSETAFIDSSAIALIFKAQHELAKRAGKFCVVGLQPSVLRVLSAVLQKNEITFCDTLEDALAR